jgi:D-glycero-alpha-D-manno-heptose-7-phosphate kinase
MVRYLSARPRAVRARAPLRLGLAGGGTDIAAYATARGGAVLNVTIDRFAFAHLTLLDDGELRFRAADLGVTDGGRVGEPLPRGQGLSIHRAVYNRITADYFGGKGPSVSLTTTVDAPAGSGLGSSSALCVAIVAAFASAFDLPLGSYDVARLAHQVERIDLKLAGGKQDHYSAAFGGLNFIEFSGEKNVTVNPLNLKTSYAREFESSIVICFTGQSRDSASIIEKQIDAIETLNSQALLRLDSLKRDAFDMKDAVLHGDLERVARILNRSWAAKRALITMISNDRLDEIHRIAMQAGATAGKISGAGGGGFFMFLTQPENRLSLIQALAAAGLPASPVYFTPEGAETWTTR